ncbi:MAG: hypothetical protein H0V70_05845, partial [Ktedonobacteraceae bacterium]|nr:hypothetical protein [Ktedonobacteraceae bacterium]
KATKPTSEVIHTNQKHPFLTVEKGFLPVGQIKLGMHVVEANGQVGVVSGWRMVPGVKVMYNLEVAHDHTFVVGVGMWVVHNCGAPISENVLNRVDDAWHPANRGSSLSNFLDHFDKHAEEVGAGSTEQYLNKAQSFWTSVIQKGSAKGVQSWSVDGATGGLTRYVKGNISKYIDVFDDGRINSFGAR